MVKNKVEEIIPDIYFTFIFTFEDNAKCIINHIIHESRYSFDIKLKRLTTIMLLNNSLMASS